MLAQIKIAPVKSAILIIYDWFNYLIISYLFTDAEPRKNILKDIFWTDFAGDWAEVIEDLADFFTKQIRWKALAHCQEDEEVFIIGGASVYAEALPLAHRLYLTEVDATAEHADVWFPELCRDDWRLVRSEAHEPDEKNAAPYTFADYERVTR